MEWVKQFPNVEQVVSTVNEVSNQIIQICSDTLRDSLSKLMILHIPCNCTSTNNSKPKYPNNNIYKYTKLLHQLAASMQQPHAAKQQHHAAALCSIDEKGKKEGFVAKGNSSIKRK